MTIGSTTPAASLLRRALSPAGRVDAPWIALLSSPRSGTTHVIRLMEALAGLYPCREEWLNIFGVPWVGDRMLDRLNRAHRTRYAQFADPALGAWARADFARTLDFVQKSAPLGTRAMVVKVLHPDLTAAEFEQLFLASPQHMVLVLQRAPIDSFISLCKAKAVNKWNMHDTTCLSITLDAAEFLAEWQRQSTWHHALRHTLEQDGRPYGLLDYERDVLPGEDHAIARLIEELGRAGLATRLKPKVAIERQAHRALATAGAALQVPTAPPRPIGLPLQDRSPSRAAKVTNWDAFLVEIRRLGADEGMLESYGVWD